jgi:hypothetical protein
MRRVYISEEICQEALAKARKMLESKATGQQPAATQLRAADLLIKACQTQERYNLRPLSEGEMDYHRSNPETRVSRLEDMTTEQLLELRSDLDSD